ncbi:unnamed protein product, partial [Soboliphyme baturini]|uniref:Calmodulin n=1 Tax=Soboliphyme baturini TaxID=241478 RepID=A0A183ITL0_9BILA
MTKEDSVSAHILPPFDSAIRESGVSVHGERNSLGLSSVREKELRRLYKQLDVDGDGHVNIRDLVAALKTRMPGQPDIPSYAMQMMEEADINHSKTISFAEFAQYVMDQEMRLAVVFNDCDTNRDGQLDSKEIKSYFAELNLPISDNEVDRIIRKMDADGSTTIELEEFQNYLMFYPCSTPSDIANFWRASLVIDVGEDIVRYEDHVGNWWQHMISGGIAGSVSRTFTAPLDRIKVFLQVHANRVNKIGFISGMKMLYSEGGLQSMWRG